MKVTRQPFYFLILVLLTIGIGFSLYRHMAFDVPFLPGEKQQIWSIESKVEFETHGDPVKVSLAIPSIQAGFTQLAEHTASAGYGLSYEENGLERRAQWTIRSANGKQILYYRMDVLVDQGVGQEGTFTVPEIGVSVIGNGPHETSALTILEQAINRSADPYSLTSELIREFNTQTQRSEFLNQNRPRIDWLVALLHSAQVPARKVLGLRLEDGRRRQRLQTYLQVFDGNEYRIFDPRSGKLSKTENLLLWEAHSAPLVDVIGGNNTTVTFSMIEQEVPVSEALANGFARNSSLLDFSIHSLPLEEQALFKGILLIPVGVLVVVFMRVFVGLRTSGTFMPVLIAMSFIQTTLITGIVGFILIVSSGLVIRSYLSQLNLLLIARISAVIITVIILIAAISVIAYQMGLSEGLKITFFPMVILSWTIERMSILWEEEGPQEVVVQSGGSLIVAVVTYMMLTNDLLRHLTFNFLGLQLVFMALVLMLGSYTGYRLLEFRRFKPFYADPMDDIPEAPAPVESKNKEDSAS